MSGSEPRPSASLSDVAFHLVQMEMGAASVDTAELLAMMRELASEGGLRPGASALLSEASERLAAAGELGDDARREAAREAGLLVERAENADVDDRPTAADEPDPELMEAFVGESLEALEAAERAGLALEGHGPDGEALNTMFRCFHTVKGTAGFLDMDPVVDVAHAAESLLDAARRGEGELGPENLQRVFQAIDVLRRLVEAAGDPAAMASVPWQAVVADLGLAVGRSDPGPAAPKAPSPDSGSAADVDSRIAWTRVRTDRLDGLVDAIGELVIAHSMIAEEARRGAAADPALDRRIATAAGMLRDLQDLGISMRMVPMRGAFQRIARAVRDLARKRGAGIDLVIHGEDTEIDRNMVELVADPLLHMVRNAVDHGIESPEERRRLGKPERGVLTLSATSEGGKVIIQLRDDGRGIDREKIQERARRAGISVTGRDLTDSELLDAISTPGFSTTDRVTDVSGRGVGMDVVRRHVEALHGAVELQSVAGAGSTFTLRMPLTLAITDGMLVRVGGERYVIPIAVMDTSLRPDASALTTVAGRGELVRVREALLPMLRLHRLLDVPEAETDPTRGILVVAGGMERRCALLVDEILGQVHVVSKPVGGGVGEVRGVSGGAVLGDGRVGLILDVPALLALAAERPMEKGIPT